MGDLRLALAALSIFFVFACSLISAANVPVNNLAELKSALQLNTGDEIIIQDDILITSTLPTITTSLVIRSSDATCLTKSSKKRRCILVAKEDYRHLSVGKGGALTVRNLAFRSGIGSSGGSLLVTDGGSLVVRDCSFRFNRATSTLGGGGAISVQTGSTLLVERSLFIRNSGPFGGAIDVSGQSTANISTSTFNRNWGKIVGGAISTSLGSNVLIYKNSFSRNNGYFGGVSYVKGSAISFCNNLYKYKNAAGLNGDLNYADSSTIRICSESKSSFFLGSSSPSSTIKTNCSACFLSTSL